jgi:hypothetical protein
MVECWACKGTGWFRSSISGMILQNCHCSMGLPKTRQYHFISTVQKLIALSESVTLV